MSPPSRLHFRYLFIHKYIRKIFQSPTLRVKTKTSFTAFVTVGYFVTCNAPPQLVVYIKISIRFTIQSLYLLVLDREFIATSLSSEFKIKSYSLEFTTVTTNL